MTQSTQPDRLEPLAPAEAKGLSLLDEDQIRQHHDWAWCLSQPDLLIRHAGEVVGVYRQQVWGAGKDHPAAVRSAEERIGERAGIDGVPFVDELVYVVMPQRDPSLALVS